MIRTLQCIDHKNIPIVTSAEALKRGAIVNKSWDNKVSNATEAGFGLLDIAPNYDGINAVAYPGDAAFEDVAEGALCLYIPVHSGERYATSECPSGLTDGDKLSFGAGGQFAANAAGEWKYCGVYDDPCGIPMYIVEKL